MVDRKTLRFYGIWVLIGAGIMALVFAILLSLEWRPVYQYRDWYRDHPAPEETMTAKVVRNPRGSNLLRIFLEDDGFRIVDLKEKAPPGVEVLYREYSYRLVTEDGGEIDIYGAGLSVWQIRLLSGNVVDIIGKRVWYEIDGVKVKEEFWPKRLRVSDRGGQ
jgi:hypothetical protein